MGMFSWQAPDPLRTLHYLKACEEVILCSISVKIQVRYNRSMFYKAQAK